jgi:hypothetical protein
MQTPKGNEILTRSGKIINPLNVTSESVSVLDVIHALAYQPMFGGMTRSFYSKAEHSCNMYDYLRLDTDTYIAKYGKKQECIYDLKRNQMLLFCLMYFSGEAYLQGIFGQFQSYKDHNPRVIGSVLNSLGEEFLDYKKCAGLLDVVHKDVCNDMYSRYYDVPDKHNYLTPYMAMKRFVAKLNEVAPFEVKIRDGNCYIHKVQVDEHGQGILDFSIPALTW